MDGDDTRIRVLWITKGLGPGGAERLLASFAERGDKEEFSFSAAYVLPWKDHLAPRLRQAGVEVTCVGTGSVATIAWVTGLRRLLRDGDFDVVHHHSPLVAAVTRIVLRTLPKRLRPASVSTEHNTWGSFHPVTRYANKVTLPLDDTVFAVSDEVRLSAARRLRQRIEVLVHGVDVDGIRHRSTERDDRREELGFGSDEVVVVTVANLREGKDYPNLLEAARTVCDQRSDVHFVAVGQGPLDSELELLRDELGLSDRFRFLGYQEDPIGVLAAADLFCLASRHEGLPIALLEAMAIGLPVVATAVGGVPQVVTNGIEGYLVPPADPEALAGAILRTIDPTTRSTVAAASSERSSAFDIQRAVDRQQREYRTLAVQRDDL